MAGNPEHAPYYVGLEHNRIGERGIAALRKAEHTPGVFTLFNTEGQAPPPFPQQEANIGQGSSLGQSDGSREEF